MINKLISMYNCFGTFNLKYHNIMISKKEIKKEDIKTLENYYNVRLARTTKEHYIFHHNDRIKRILDLMNENNPTELNDNIHYVINELRLTDDDKMYFTSIGIDVNDYIDDIPF